MSSVVLAGRWITTLTPVSRTQAVERYHAEVRESTPAVEKSRRSSPVPVDVKSRDVGAAGTPDGREPVSRQKETFEVVLPEPGVYTYRTEGYEHAGFRREFPAESHRIVGRIGDHTSTVHHIYSEERDEWYDFDHKTKGAEMLFRRNKGTFGPITIDRTLRFDPPVLAFPTSPSVGDTWSGSWSGPNPGTYTAKTRDRTRLDVGGTSVDAWVHELFIRFEGSEYGEFRVTMWYSPAHAMILKEVGDAEIHTGPLDYRSEYTLTLESLEAER